jgi:hypothetical protein
VLDVPEWATECQTKVLRRMLPNNTVTQIAKIASHILDLSIHTRSKAASSASGIDLSISAMFKGILMGKQPIVFYIGTHCQYDQDGETDHCPHGPLQTHIQRI